MLQRYPSLTPKERENAICKEYGAVFIEGIGAPLSDGKVHDDRAADYDDWTLNGDILIWYPVLDKAIELNQNRLDLRIYKISALLDYEKDSPDMALSNLKALIDYDGHNHPSWEYPGYVSDANLFPSLMQDCCYAFFLLGTPSSYEAFKELSEKMVTYYPKAYEYTTNIGSYYLVYKHDSKTALKYYNKVLKKVPNDYATLKNCVLLARNDKNVKLEKKYLPMLIKATENETEKASYQARLSTL